MIEIQKCGERWQWSDLPINKTSTSPSLPPPPPQAKTKPRIEIEFVWMHAHCDYKKYTWIPVLYTLRSTSTWRPRRSWSRVDIFQLCSVLVVFWLWTQLLAHSLVLSLLVERQEAWSDVKTHKKNCICRIWCSHAVRRLSLPFELCVDEHSSVVEHLTADLEVLQVLGSTTGAGSFFFFLSHFAIGGHLANFSSGSLFPFFLE